MTYLCTLILGCLFTINVHADALRDTQRIASDSLRVNEMRARVSAENMANAKSSGYAPKTLGVKTTKLPSGARSVGVSKIGRDQSRLVKTYDPSHPQADQDGYVKMPDINPMVELMNMQESRLSTERGLKAYETATNMRHKIISLMTPR